MPVIRRSHSSPSQEIERILVAPTGPSRLLARLVWFSVLATGLIGLVALTRRR
jgi:hypothetical protein